jgi:hypothetical protein
MIPKGKNLSKIIPKMKINLEKYSEIISKDKKLISNIVNICPLRSKKCNEADIRLANKQT